MMIQYVDGFERDMVMGGRGALKGAVADLRAWGRKFMAYRFAGPVLYYVGMHTQDDVERFSHEFADAGMYAVRCIGE